MDKDDSYVKEKFRHIPGNDSKFPIEDFFDFRSNRNEKLWTYKYPAENPVALVIIFHGLHAYCNNYAVMAKYFSEIGCEVVAFDWIGHGKSEGIRGFLPSFASLFNDCCEFILLMINYYPNLPIYLAGGSLGGAISIMAENNFKELRKIKGLILFSPAVKANVKCEMLARGLAKFVSVLTPKLKLSKGDPDKFCPNEDVKRFIEENPFIYSDKIRAGTLGTAVRIMQRASELVQTISAPFVVIQGGNDLVVDPEAGEVLFQDAKIADKSFWMYPSLSHALLFEKEIYEILSRVQDWLSQRIKSDLNLS